FKTAKSYGRRVTAMGINSEELWLGYYNSGVQIVNLKTGATRSPNIPANKDLAITTIVHTGGGYSWIGTYNQGLFRVKGDEVVAYFNAQDSANSIPDPTIVFIIETQDGLMLIGTETAMYQVDPSTDAVHRLEPVIKENTKSPVLVSAAENINGDIWLSVKDMGLFIWRKTGSSRNTAKLEALPGNTNLPSTTIYAIEFDDEGFAWVSTTRGIAKLTGSGELVDIYTTADGLQGNDFNQSSSFKDSRGRIYFGGSNGYNRFDPSLKTSTPPRPPVVLTKLNIAGTEPTLPVAIHKLESLELSYLDYFVTLDFSVLDYADPKNNHYRYKLENFDPQWIENDTKNSATYTNLPPGDYTFRVQGASSAGAWNREGVSLDIVIHPAPWRSWQACVFYFFVFFVLARLGKHYYDNIMLRKKATIIAREMHYAADKATDDLQEQLDYQDEFVKVVHTHSANTLELIGDFISLQANPQDNSHRIAALSQLEACLLYQGDELLANLEAYTNLVISELLNEQGCDAQSITTINEIPEQLVDANLASSLSIVIYELLRNSFQRANKNQAAAKFIQIRLEEVFDGVLENTRKFKLSVADNIEHSIDNSSPSPIETSGMAIVSLIAKRLNGAVVVSSDDGTKISLTFSAAKVWHES
ncbi:MAG: two-component sensor histidine kinase, partial [Halioglobus sp.]